MMRHNIQLVIERGIQILGIVVKKVILKKFIPYIQLRNLQHIQLSVSITSAEVLFLIQKQLLDTFLKSVCSSIVSNATELVTATPK